MELVSSLGHERNLPSPSISPSPNTMREEEEREGGRRGREGACCCWGELASRRGEGEKDGGGGGISVREEELGRRMGERGM